MVSEERETDGSLTDTQTDRDERDKVVCLLTGDLREAAGERKWETLFSSLNETGRNVSLPTAPRGIIKDGDAKDSLIRFFNYWGFTSPSIVAQLRKLIKN